MKHIWLKWKKLVEKTGNFQISVIFSVLYFVMVTPIGIVLNLLYDFLETRKLPGWSKYGAGGSSLEKLEKQY